MGSTRVLLALLAVCLLSTLAMDNGADGEPRRSSRAIVPRAFFADEQAAAATAAEAARIERMRRRPSGDIKMR